ncbi:hypothetical protein HK104_008760 [Borealophlyctis nickersoniae]|nr:hypothetical protein HK104_008760 [Borealophlyctis nickersoniae]
MPKIVSSSTVSTSTELPDATGKNLHTYYCIFCNEYVLIVDKRLKKLPRRKTDRAYIVSQKRTYKPNLEREGEYILIKRPNGYEKQRRYQCPQCKVPVAYEQKGDILYIFENAVRSAEAATGSAQRAKDLNKEAALIQMTAEQLLQEDNDSQDE